MARREWSFWVEMVNSWKSGLLSLFSSQKQASSLPSEVAIAGMDRPLCSKTGRAPTSEGPKSETITSIWGFLAIAAVSTCCVSAGSQFVTSNGSSPMKVYLPVGSRTSCSPSASSVPWLLPGGPLRNRMLPPSGRFCWIHWAQSVPACLKSLPMKTS